jgi:diadenosine tetraphosphate (Ap4A) HIT family hydrolase
MHHTRKTVKQYEKLNSNDANNSIECSFCHTVPSRKWLAENETMVVIENRVPYDFFETRKTTGEHYLLLPKRHVEAFAEFTDQEKIDFTTLAGEYEAQGFNAYARGLGNMGRSQPHQHTHLIKLINKQPKLHLYIGKPYFMAHID